ncbi:type IV toxin-antitoxin system AbiEi family antitoxin domain-containing protein [Herbiconiux sp. P18]|uniref:type IV toxin-antitoxin system AbiEi family antitoxin domain-containing protein n=1 Tax=Herbiconiux liangxiaofengii TaxID=3342795 RepID=UPI0035BAADD9
MLFEVLESRGGVASTVELAGLGVPVRQVTAAVRRGDLVRVRRGWVALPRADPELVASVAVGGALSCTSVLVRYGVWCAHDDRRHVRVPPHAGRSKSSGTSTRLHRTGLLPHTGTAIDSFASALAVSVMCQPQVDAIVSLDSALRLGLVTRATLHEVLAPLSASHRRYLDRVDPASGSGLESKARLRLTSRRVRLRSQVHIAGVGFVDLLLGDRLVLEVDGHRWHSTREAFTEDRRRDLELTRRGYRVVRLSYTQVMHDWEACEEVLLGLIRRDEHRWPVRTGGESRR